MVRGLICYSYLNYKGRSLKPEGLEEAAIWLEQMASDELLGDEYVKMLCDEEGGKELIAAIDAANKVASKGNQPSPPPANE